MRVDLTLLSAHGRDGAMEHSRAHSCQRGHSSFRCAPRELPGRGAFRYTRAFAVAAGSLGFMLLPRARA
jgi:hypothetical protein